jgi:hypothetical protein
MEAFMAQNIVLFLRNFFIYKSLILILNAVGEGHFGEDGTAGVRTQQRGRNANSSSIYNIACSLQLQNVTLFVLNGVINSCI